MRTDSAWIRTLKPLAIVATAVATIWATGLASAALTQYRTANRVARSNQLQQVDREITKMSFDKPYLDSIWASTSPAIQGKPAADAKLQAIWNAGATRRSRASRWDTVPDLETLLYAPSAFSSLGAERLRQAYLLCETVLYLVVDAIDAERQLLLDPAETRIYTAYIEDLGDHPLFLHSLWFAHESGYITPQNQHHLRTLILADPSRSNTVAQIYPDLLRPDWVTLPTPSASSTPPRGPLPAALSPASAFALVLSVLSLGGVLYFGWCTRDHQRRSVTPIPYISPSDYEDRLTVRLWNHGTGPMILNSVVATDARDNRKADLVDLLPPLPEDDYYSDFVAVESGRPILPGKCITLMAYQPDDDDPDQRDTRNRLRDALGHISIRVDYTGVYREHFDAYTRDLAWFHRQHTEDPSQQELDDHALRSRSTIGCPQDVE